MEHGFDALIVDDVCDEEFDGDVADLLSYRMLC